MQPLDQDVCYRALQTRDPRFDGRLFVGVVSTGVYCRPICPARTPKRGNCRFFSSSATAQAAGFRACLRCRPEISPELACWRGTSNTVSRALALIADGFLDREDGTVETLAAHVGMGARQLRRLFDQHLGASPVAVAQTRRLLFAKQLIHDTRLSMAEVAMAGGFGSLRRFNDAFRTLYHRPPRELRRSTMCATANVPAEARVTLHVPYRAPYDWEAMLDYLGARAIDGLEVVENGIYRRVVSYEGAHGAVAIAHVPGRHALLVTIQFPSIRALQVIVTCVRHLFDVGADVDMITAHLSKDLTLAPLIASRPGLRAPGCWDGFELAVRAVLGQQVTVEGARRLGNKLILLCGDPVPNAVDARLARTFPSAGCLARVDLSSIGMPASRRATVNALAQAAVANPRLFTPLDSIEDRIAQLRAIRGIGEWTAQYIALRAMREPDAFPATDLGILRGAAHLGGVAPTALQLLQRAEAWRPWRAYAAQHLWAAGSHNAHTGREVNHAR
ncbi:MAG: putative ada regulatory protein [Nitrospira sp.]|jgi:AraC family transcriptional regulator of adaptative response / DNA-3-methyladenine glycosylase II|nr:putative ada regulatory protein [Nitrospira sp.]